MSLDFQVKNILYDLVHKDLRISFWWTTRNEPSEAYNCKSFLFTI